MKIRHKSPSLTPSRGVVGNTTSRWLEKLAKSIQKSCQGQLLMECMHF